MCYKGICKHWKQNGWTIHHKGKRQDRKFILSVELTNDKWSDQENIISKIDIKSSKARSELSYF